MLPGFGGCSLDSGSGSNNQIIAATILGARKREDGKGMMELLLSLPASLPKSLQQRFVLVEEQACWKEGE
jgi:hypothetical protein